MNLPFDVIVLDLEANGLYSPDWRIVEIGAVRLDRKLNVIDEYSGLVDGRPMSVPAIEITRITDEMLDGQLPFEVAVQRFLGWTRKLHDCQEFILAAWGAYFDIPLLRDECRRTHTNFPFPGETLDIKSLAWHKAWELGVPKKHSTVDGMRKLFNVEFSGQEHRALVDAHAEAQILKKVASWGVGDVLGKSFEGVGSSW